MGLSIQSNRLMDPRRAVNLARLESSRVSLPVRFDKALSLWISRNLTWFDVDALPRVAKSILFLHRLNRIL
jgi:hypothetical protein